MSDHRPGRPSSGRDRRTGDPRPRARGCGQLRGAVHFSVDGLIRFARRHADEAGVRVELCLYGRRWRAGRAACVRVPRRRIPRRGVRRLSHDTELQPDRERRRAEREIRVRDALRFAVGALLGGGEDVVGRIPVAGDGDHAHREQLRGRERRGVRRVLRHAALGQAIAPVEAEGEPAEQDHHGQADDDEGLPTLVLTETARAIAPWIHPTPLDRNPKSLSLGPGHKYRKVRRCRQNLRRIG